MATSRRGRRGVPAALTVLLLLAFGLVSAPSAAAEEVYVRPASGSYQLSGHGFGHGRGMSQWGAYGAAQQGVAYQSILAFYYPGTTLSGVGDDPIRVLLSTDATQLRVSQAAGLVAVESNGARTDLPADRAQWRLVPSGAGLQLQGQLAGVWSVYPLSGATEQPAPVRFESGTGQLRIWRADQTSVAYRGSAAASRSGAAVRAVLSLPLESYLRGVVPREMPSGWHPAALSAQSIAARTYAVSSMRANPSGEYHICDTTACQVFGGTTAYSASGVATPLEYASTDAAIAGTPGTIVTYQGAVAFAQFSSSNGGWTAAGSQPYLVARADPWSGTAPGDTAHSWTATLPVSALEARYPAIGQLQRLVVTGRDGHGDWGGRVLTARLEGTSGSINVTGEDIRFSYPYPTNASGLKSSWFAIAFPERLPIGSLDVASWSGGGIHLAGWALDPDTPDPIQVHVQVDGVTVAGTTASTHRPDVGAAYPGFGDFHGFDVTIPAPPGSHRVCGFGINVGAGWPNSVIGCATVAVPQTTPIGALDSATWVSSGVRVAGWGLDPDTAAPIEVHVQVDGVTVSGMTAAQNRSDIGAIFPGHGPNHGFDGVVPASPAGHGICAFGINIGPGWPNSVLGCRTVAAPTRPPTGVLDVVQRVGSSLRVAGWALDPDTPEPIEVHVQVDGVTVAGIAATAYRSDVGAAFPGLGNYHGFDATVSASSGPHNVCVYAINIGSGWPNAFLGCRSG